MLFLARMDINFPDSMDAETIADFAAKEKAYSQEMQEKGKIKGIWRVVGEYSNYTILDVEDHDELHAALSGLPMFRYLDIKVTPLANHPNAMKYYLKD